MLPSEVVIDASVVVSAYVGDQVSAASLELLALIAMPDPISRDYLTAYVPSILYYEVASALRKNALRNTAYQTARQDLLSVMRLSLVVSDCVPLSPEALDIALTYRVSTYDAYYLALAAQQHAPLITADKRLIGGSQGTPFDVRYVADVIF